MRIQSLPLRFILRVKCHPRRFQLRVGDPGAFESLQPKLAKVDSEITEAVPLTTSSLGLPILHAFGINGITILLKLPQRPRRRD